MWILLIPPDLSVSAKFETSLFSTSPALSALWLIIRIFGTAVIVPILEELAFRGFMQPQIQAYIQNRVGAPRTVAIVAALALTSLAFGLMHSDWIAGTAAGVLYGLLRLWSGKVGDAILAHAVTNFVLAMYALLFGYWSYF
jgi:CAAX prenyl protease-like protein